MSQSVGRLRRDGRSVDGRNLEPFAIGDGRNAELLIANKMSANSRRRTTDSETVVATNHFYT